MFVLYYFSIFKFLEINRSLDFALRAPLEMTKMTHIKKSVALADDRLFLFMVIYWITAHS